MKNDVPNFFIRTRDYVIDSDQWRFCGVFDSKYNPILWLVAAYYATHNHWIYRDHAAMLRRANKRK